MPYKATFKSKAITRESGYRLIYASIYTLEHNLPKDPPPPHPPNFWSQITLPSLQNVRGDPAWDQGHIGPKQMQALTHPVPPTWKP